MFESAIYTFSIHQQAARMKVGKESGATGAADHPRPHEFVRVRGAREHNLARRRGAAEERRCSPV